jgi:hypothetical protein
MYLAHVELVGGAFGTRGRPATGTAEMGVKASRMLLRALLAKVDAMHDQGPIARYVRLVFGLHGRDL